ncbi:MAG: ATP-binding cassette domain-containing protein [Proteobacteria bacterium]|nr:ATP-binding cassette domain-containing protein [Pseudomonadota bacterium]
MKRFFAAENKAQKTTNAVSGEPYVKVRDLHKTFGTHQVLKGVSLDVPRRKITVIIGGSGSGKSVLLKHILGLFTPDSGTVNVNGLELTKCTEREREIMRTKIGMLFQGAALFDSMTVRENVAFPLSERLGAPSKKEINARVDEMLERLKLTDIAEAWPADISAGQRKRVGLARAIITKPELMIYDEPTTGQDPIMIRYVDDMILEAHDLFQLTTIVISHDMVSTFRIADQIAMVYEGVIASKGTPAELMASDNPNVQRMIRAQIPV